MLASDVMLVSAAVEPMPTSITLEDDSMIGSTTGVETVSTDTFSSTLITRSMPSTLSTGTPLSRSEERRVWKECRL